MFQDTVSDLGAGRALVADACRVLAGRGLTPGFLGHVSLRVDAERLLVRCRGPRERGLAWTTAEDIRLVDLDGAAAADGELDSWSVPNELPLHTEVLRTRPEVAAVVHAHPEHVVTADLAGISIRPIVGAFDIPGARLAAGGVPVYPRGVLIRNRLLAAEMTTAMNGRPVVLLRGHGLTSAAGSVQDAVLQAISVDRLARLSLAVVAADGQLRDLPAEDLAELPDLGGGLNTRTAWRHELARLALKTGRGGAVPPSGPPADAPSARRSRMATDSTWIASAGAGQRAILSARAARSQGTAPSPPLSDSALIIIPLAVRAEA